MRITAKARASRSRLRQRFSTELRVWEQRERDMGAAQHLNDQAFNSMFVWQAQTKIAEIQDIPKKLAFIRQEQAKLKKALRSLDRGVSRQRAWANGKFIYQN